MVLELITRLEIDRTPSSSQGNEEENSIKVNVREERDCDNVPLRTGLRVWSASFIFGENVLLDEIENKKVLELGAGTGIVSLALALSGCNARTIHATDGDLTAARLLRENIARNALGDKVTVRLGTALSI